MQNRNEHPDSRLFSQPPGRSSGNSRAAVEYITGVDTHQYNPSNRHYDAGKPHARRGRLTAHIRTSRRHRGPITNNRGVDNHRKQPDRTRQGRGGCVLDPRANPDHLPRAALAPPPKAPQSLLPPHPPLPARAIRRPAPGGLTHPAHLPSQLGRRHPHTPHPTPPAPRPQIPPLHPPPQQPLPLATPHPAHAGLQPPVHHHHHQHRHRRHLPRLPDLLANHNQARPPPRAQHRPAHHHSRRLPAPARLPHTGIDLFPPHPFFPVDASSTAAAATTTGQRQPPGQRRKQLLHGHGHGHGDGRRDVDGALVAEARDSYWYSVFCYWDWRRRWGWGWGVWCWEWCCHWQWNGGTEHGHAVASAAAGCAAWVDGFGALAAAESAAAAA